jgi:hypothetical protein
MSAIKIYQISFLSRSQREQGAAQLNSSSKVEDRSERACETLLRLVFSTCTTVTIDDSYTHCNKLSFI